MATISLQGIEKSFGLTRVIDNLSLDVADGEFVVFVGPSGCGKSTTLRLLAGLETPSAGRILIGDRDVTSLPPGERDVAMVFQNYALYPHMTVAQNMSFSLRLNHVPKAEITRRVMEAAQILHIDALLDRKPKELSGGQRQRVAMGRAIVRAPSAFLFDEPLSNLDAQLRGHMRSEIAQLRKRVRGTIVYVTHDQVEAMTLADRIVILDAGRIQQVGTPEEVFERPANLFVAQFIGSPTMNLLQARLSAQSDRLELAGGVISLPLPSQAAPPLAAPPLAYPTLARPSLKSVPAELLVGIRPQALHLEPDPQTGFELAVETFEYLGTETMVSGRVVGAPNCQITAIIPGALVARGSQRVRFSIYPHAYHLFDAQSGLRIASDRAAKIGGLREAS